MRFNWCSARPNHWMKFCYTSDLNQLHRFDSVSAFPYNSESRLIKREWRGYNKECMKWTVRSSAVCQFAAVLSVKFGIKLAKMFVYGASWTMKFLIFTNFTRGVDGEVSHIGYKTVLSSITFESESFFGKLLLIHYFVFETENDLFPKQTLKIGIFEHKDYRWSKEYKIFTIILPSTISNYVSTIVGTSSFVYFWQKTNTFCYFFCWRVDWL